MRDSLPLIDLLPEQLLLVQEILAKHISDRDVFVFGSRATHTAKEYSDLDLAVFGNEPLAIDVRAALKEEFGESDLPFKVDIIDWTEIDESFRDIIRRDCITLPRQGTTACL